MSAHSKALPQDGRETVADLRRRLGLFSFQQDALTEEPTAARCWGLGLDLRPGGIVEWLTAGPGAGAVACAMHLAMRPSFTAGIHVIVDSAREFHAPAFSSWGINPDRTLVVWPTTPKDASWAIEQCLRCPGVSAVWAWIDQRFPTHVHRRWQVAAEAGESVGIFFRPDAMRREPAWTDLRVLVTPLAGGRGETRRVRVETLYRRGGLGGTARVLEIDHAEGVVRLVPELANPTHKERSARA